MCTHQYKVFNRYTRKELYVKCGKCPACLQEKAAHRVFRIKNQDDVNKYDVLLVGLTYRRDACPYVKREDAYRFAHSDIFELPVYRDCSYRKVRQNAAYDIAYEKKKGSVVLDSVFRKDDQKVSFKNCVDLKHRHGCIGVTYYPDFQHFVARLRINLKRNFAYDKPITTFLCSEYGTKSKRPHAHLLLWVPKGDEEVVRSAVFESWPYGDISRWELSEHGEIVYPAVQRAFRAATYVASYVNCGDDFPKFLKAFFKPKHSYSKGFGLSSRLFQLDTILQKFQRGHLTYYCRKDKQGCSVFSELPLPKYVVHRYFPKFKGYGLLSSSALVSYMQRVRGLRYQSTDEERMMRPDLFERDNVSDMDFLRRFFEKACVENGYPLQYFSDEDFLKTSIRLDNAYYRFLSESPKYVSFKEYASLHISVWKLYASDILRLHMQNEDIPLQEKYFNLDDVKYYVDVGLSKMPVGFTHQMFAQVDPNKYDSIRVNTERMHMSYYDHLKHRSVRNAIMSSENEEF